MCWDLGFTLTPRFCSIRLLGIWYDIQLASIYGVDRTYVHVELCQMYPISGVCHVKNCFPSQGRLFGSETGSLEVARGVNQTRHGKMDRVEKLSHEHWSNVASARLKWQGTVVGVPTSWWAPFIPVFGFWFIGSW